MKHLLLSTALIAVSSAAFADNYKVQLDNLDNAFQCQNHFERGDEIAGTIDKFEFCVWYLNKDRKGFFRNDMFYDILPSGDVIAVKANQLRNKQSAEKAIKAAIEVIVEEKIVVKTETIIEEKIIEVEVESGEIIDELSKKVNDLTAEAAKLLSKLGTTETDLTTAQKEIMTLSNAIAANMKTISDLKMARDNIKAMLDAIVPEDGITQADVEAVRNELTTLLNAKTKMFNDETAKVATLTYKLGSIQAAINSAYDTNGVVYENLAAKVDDLAAERNALKQQIADIKADLASHDIVLSETAINEVYNAGKAEIQKVLDEEKAAHVETFEALTAANVAIDQHMTDLSRFENMTKELNATITSLNSDLAAKTAKITNQETKIGNLEGELKAEKATVTNLNGQIERLKEEIGTHTGNIETLEKEIEDLEGELDTANGNVTRLKGELSTAQGDADFYLKEATKLGQEVYQLTSELAAANKLAADRLEIIKELNGTIHTLQTETVPNAHADGVTAGKAAADQAVVDFNLQVTAGKVPGETWSSNPQTVAELLETTEALDGRVRLFQDQANSLQEIINGHADDRDMANATGRHAILDQIAGEINAANGNATGIPSVDQILEDRASSTGADYRTLIAGWLDTLPAGELSVDVTITDAFGVATVHTITDITSANAAIAAAEANAYQNGIAYGYDLGVDSVDVDAAIATARDNALAAGIIADLDALADNNNPLKSVSVNDAGQIVIARWDDNNTSQNYTTQTIVGVNTHFAYESDNFLQAYLDRLTTLAAYNLEYVIDLGDVVEAYQEGFKEGYDEGYKDGYRDGFDAGVKSVQ